MELSTKIVINASISACWKVFTNFSDYPRWNPFIKAIKGKIGIGNHIQVILHQPDMNPMKMTPKVLAYEDEKELKWIGHLLIPGLFDGEHSFRFEKAKDGTTIFTQKENFKGILVPLFKKMLETKTRKGFESMNERFKYIVENC